MKALSWDKLKRLVSGKKKSRDTESSRCQRSYSFKRGSMRKSSRRANAGVGKLGNVVVSGDEGNDYRSHEEDQISEVGHHHEELTGNPRNNNCRTSCCDHKIPEAHDFKNNGFAKCHPSPDVKKFPAVIIPARTPVKKDKMKGKSSDEDSSGETMNNWILMRNQGMHLGRRERAEKIYRLMSNGDSDSGDGDLDHEQKNQEEEGEEEEADDSEICEDDFYLSMLRESPRPIRHTLDSTSSRLTQESCNTSESHRRSLIESDFSEGISTSRSRLIESAELDPCPPPLNISPVSSSRSTNLGISREVICSADVHTQILHTKLEEPVILDDEEYYIGKRDERTSSSTNNLHSDYTSHVVNDYYEDSDHGLSFTNKIMNDSCSYLRVSGSRECISSSANSIFPIDDNPKSFWWSARPGSTLTTSSIGSKDSGFSLGAGWAKGLAAKVFGRSVGKSGKKGIVLSVSKEGYFQRTNFRRSAGRKLSYQVRSSIIRRSKFRRSSKNAKKSDSNNDVSPFIPVDVDDSNYFNDSASMYQVYANSGKLQSFLFSNSDSLVFVPPEKRKPRLTGNDSSSDHKKTYCQSNSDQDYIPNKNLSGHRFETIEIRLPRLKLCEKVGENNNVIITKVSCDDKLQEPGVSEFLNQRNYKSQVKSGCCPTDTEKLNSVVSIDCDSRNSNDSHCGSDQLQNRVPSVRAAVRRKQSCGKNRVAKYVVKPLSRRNSTLYRRGKLGPNFALPRPTIKLGDITQKGYEKKRNRLLAPYIPKQALGPKTSEGSASPSTRAKRRAHRRLTRNESRYHSEVRQEAVQQALAAMQNRPKPSLPMPSKRTSVMGRAPDHPHHDSGDSSTDDDSVGNEEADLDDQDSGTPPDRERDRNRVTNEPTQQIVIHSDSSSTGSARETPPMLRPPKLPERNRVSNGTPSGPVLTYSNLGNLPPVNLGWDGSDKPLVTEHRTSREDRKPQTPSSELSQPQSQHAQHQPPHHVLLQRNSRPEITDLVEAMHNLRTCTPQNTQPPDVTSTAQSRRMAPADRLNRLNQKRSQSCADETSGTLTGTGRWKVSAKIQQLLNTLKRPKRRPLPEFYEDDDIELEMAAKHRDPNAPKPEGSVMSPAVGEQLVIPSGLPRNLEAAVQRYGSATFKAPVATVLDPNGKLTITLSYGKLLSRSHKIAFALLNKTSHKGDSMVKTGDRVALVYPNNDPINFICSFYGCLFAGVVPVPIEVPLTRRDAGSQQIGFLLGSCNVQVALTSEACLKGLPKTATGEVVAFKGWPKLTWFITEHLGKTPKDWAPSSRVTDDTAAYIEYTTDRDGSVMGVTVNRATMLAHCRSLTTACNYTEGEIMVCVLDFKREVGLWHSILTAVFNGMHVIFIPYALMKVNPASWMQMITKYRASIAIVKSRDLHWGLLATRDHRDISLASLRLLFVSDGANPWSLSSCDQFLSVFQNKGLRPDAICPCASSSEVLTVSLRRPGRAGVNATGRGVLSMQGLSYGVVRVDQENSLTSLTLQDCGQVMPGAVIVVVRMDGQPYMCKTDEVGEICVHSSATGSHYWGLQGLTNQTFKVQPLQSDSAPISDAEYVRSGLLGFLGPGGLVFVCGSRNGLMSVSGRKHNADDIIATVLAVEPMKFIYRGRIAVFSIRVLRDERICVIAEQRPDCSEEESFQWMSRVLQAVDSIHQVGIYCLVLVNPNCLPKTPLGGIHLSETKRRFLEGTLHPANVLMCPHTCVTNLPKPREVHQDIGPASVMVGNIVQGNRLASAQGRDLGVVDEESDTAKKYQFISEILKWRSTSTADHVIFTLLNSKGTATTTLTCSQLHKRAERVANLLLERAKINTGDHVALVYPPGLDLVAAFYGCLYAGAVPVTVRPPHPQNLQTTLPTVRMIAEVSKSVLILSTQNVIKLLKSKEASNVVDIKSWPLTLDTDDLPKKKLPNLYRAPTAEMIAYLDFSVSTTGMLAGIKMSHSAVTSLCRSMKLACELYPSRHVALCLDPYCGLGFALWCLSSVYSGHHSILIPPSEVEVNPALWLSAVSQYKVRDTFCSYGVMELCTKGLGSSVNLLKQRNVNLACVRTCVVVAEERPRINLTNSFSKLFSAVGLSPRAVSTSFGCRVNVAICLQGASSPEPSTVYVDLRALRNDRVTLVERGAPHSLCVMESGKLLPGTKVIIANPETKGQCGDSHLGEIWVQSPHNASGYFTIFGDESSYADHFNSRLVTGSTGDVYARTGYLGFLRRTENVQADGELHDAVFVVGALDETIMLRGMRYHPIDIENSILRCHKKIAECAVFTWTNLLVVVVELEGNESEALDVVPLVTNCVLEDHFLVVGVVVVVDPGVVPINSRGEKQRMHLRDGFLADQLDPIFVAYNM
ncbi:unnamed protein product [Allacma fusca]|uniref:DMAP1-binding domain-containing protein n=1 Tax=Allacma fusca TaxID=39272 RepID=A0A8J2NXF8_9HEXA|nr:unnamed protein product [Allacma fusca]